MFVQFLRLISFFSDYESFMHHSRQYSGLGGNLIICKYEGFQTTNPKLRRFPYDKSVKEMVGLCELNACSLCIQSI